MKRAIFYLLITAAALSMGGCYISIGGWGHDHDRGGYHDRNDQYDRNRDRGTYNDGNAVGTESMSGTE